MSRSMILAALKSGPKSNEQLQAICASPSDYISRTAASLTKLGKIKRVDGAAGRGTRAVYALVDWKGSAPKPVKNVKLVRHLSPEEETLFRAMVRNRCSQNELTIEFKCAAETVKRWLAERDLKLNPRHKGRPRKRPEPFVGTIELAVDRLRKKHIVFAETTARYPYSVPRPYTMQTLFRVGERANVTADELMRLAA